MDRLGGLAAMAMCLLTHEFGALVAVLVGSAAMVGDVALPSVSSAMVLLQIGESPALACLCIRTVPDFYTGCHSRKLNIITAARIMTDCATGRCLRSHDHRTPEGTS